MTKNSLGHFFLFSLVSIFTLIQPRLLSAAEIPSQFKSLHVLNRLGFGPRPGDIEHVNDMGVQNYIHQQLFPETIKEPSGLVSQLKALRTYSLDPQELFEQYGPSPLVLIPRRKDIIRQRKQDKKAEIIAREAMQARLMQAIESPRQLQEVMVEFWFNHFNVYVDKDMVNLWIGNYEREAIRPYVFGHFRDLLKATLIHPAMIVYLDNVRNSTFNKTMKNEYVEVLGNGVNENYARELMELHTMGSNGGYTQGDVVALAHILTGWGFHFLPRENYKAVNFPDPYFDPGRHDFSDKVFLGKTIKGRGEMEIEQVLDILSGSPATARHISFQLAQYFVSDDPDPALVERLAKKFQETDGDIRAVLQTLFESPQFWDEKNYADKFKTPFQYIISLMRASGQKVTHYDPLFDELEQLGMPLYRREDPDGYKNTQAAWLNGDGMLKRIDFASMLAFGFTNINDKKTPVPYGQLMAEFGDQLSQPTKEAIQKGPAWLRSMLVMASWEVMQK